MTDRANSTLCWEQKGQGEVFKGYLHLPLCFKHFDLKRWILKFTPIQVHTHTYTHMQDYVA